VVSVILYKLKIGIQWSYLPVETLFCNEALNYKTFYGHFRNWSKAEIWQLCWTDLLKKHKSRIDLSSGDFDGRHTTTLLGGWTSGLSKKKFVKQQILYIS